MHVKNVKKSIIVQKQNEKFLNKERQKNKLDLLSGSWEGKHNTKNDKQKM